MELFGAPVILMSVRHIQKVLRRKRLRITRHIQIKKDLGRKKQVARLLATGNRHEQCTSEL